MAAAADRVFRDGEFRRKGPADRVVFAAFGRDVAEQAVELFEFGHVRLAVDDVSFVGQDADQVAGEVGFDGADAQGNVSKLAFIKNMKRLLHEIMQWSLFRI